MIYSESVFELALQSNEAAFDLKLSDKTVAQLGEYYSLLTRWNDRLHLVAPCSPAKFAVRHVLESLMLLHHLPQHARVADVGSGGGLPIIPCLIARPDLEATLIESSPKKAVFLREASKQLKATIIARPFEDVPAQAVSFVTCRALDQFMKKLPALIEWAPGKLLLFGGEMMAEELGKHGVKFEQLLIPLSEKRYLFVTTD